MVLCPELYQRLVAKFGDVRVSNDGEELVLGSGGGLLASRNGQQSGRPRVIHSGEYYRVCCPKCGDTRHRLWINHRAVEFPWMIICFNERCYDTPEERQQLLRFLFHRVPGTAPQVLPGKKVDADDLFLEEVDLPGEVVPLHELPLSHRANAYLASRGYDPVELSRTYGLCYCEKSEEYKQCSDRIIIPILVEGRLVGWQARFIGERNWKSCPFSKYYDKPGMKKSRLFYNYDWAAISPFVVIVEGASDVWSVGKCAMALLGKTMSFVQKRILAFPPFRDKPVVMMLDGDAAVDNDLIAYELQGEHEAGVVIVRLPHGRDPGSLSPEANMDLIYSYAKQQMVNLPGE